MKTSRLLYIIATIVVFLIGVDSANELLDDHSENGGDNRELTKTSLYPESPQIREMINIVKAKR